ncbi:MAG: diguanylate cyclase [bacterium]
MSRRPGRALALGLAYTVYAAAAVAIYVGARTFPPVADPQLHELASEAVIVLVAIVWSVLLFREMDTPVEQALILIGVGLLFVGAFGDCLGEFFVLPFPYELLENAGMPLGLVVLTGGLGLRMVHHRAYANRLRRERDASEDLAMRDALTGLYNRRYLRRGLEELLRQADESAESICLAFIDADNFKQVNDRFGHDTGDAFLVGLSRVIADAVRESDVAVRFGGDEFIIVLVGTGVDHAVHVAERIQVAVRKLGRPYAGRQPGGIAAARGDGSGPTVSIGIAAHVPGESGLQLIARADEAMYAAKRDGKDRLAVA